MKIFNQNYTALLSNSVKHPRVTIGISFDDDDTDVLYVTSHSDSKYPDGATVISDCIESGTLSVFTQELDIEKSTSTIGQMSFSLMDIGGALSTIIGTKEVAGFGLRHKRVVVYSGFEGQNWDNYEVDCTYIVSNVSQDEMSYSFTCTDVNRLLRTKIFDVDKENLLSSVFVNDKTFSVAATDFVASTKEITVVDGTYNAQDFYIGMDFQVTGSASNNTDFTVASIDESNPKTKLIVNEVVVDESGSSATASHILRVKITGSILDKFQPIEHDSSYNSWPSDTIGLIIIDDEIMLHDGVENDPTAGYSIAIRENGRGVIDTPVQEHIVDSSVDTGRNPEVLEVAYLEGPAPKLALALLTGTLYGQSGTLPDHWNCGVPAKYIRTSDFVNIGTDIWNPADDSGRSLQFFISESVSGKDFIEKQIMLWLGCVMPIYGDGALGLKKIPSMLSVSGYVATIDDSVSYKRDKLNRNMTKVTNKVIIDWGKVALQDKYTKTTALIDANSIETHKEGTPKRFKFDGVRTGKHTDSDLVNYLNVWRDLYSAPPYEFSVTVLHKMLRVEPGDAVRVSLPQHTDAVNNVPFDKVMMVTSKRSNPLTGDVRFSLIGPSAKPTPLEPIDSSIKLDDSYYLPSGSSTDISSLVTIITGVIQADVLLTGTDDMNSLASVFYYGGDLEIPSGVTVTVFDNVQLRIKGHLTINGDIVSSGSSNLGGDGENLVLTATDFISSGKVVKVLDHADQCRVGDFLRITGSSFNDRDYEIASVISNIEFTVFESLTDESGSAATVTPHYSMDVPPSATNLAPFFPSENRAISGVSGFGANGGEGSVLVSGFNLFNLPSKATNPDDGIGEFSRFLTLKNNGTELEGLPNKFSGSGGAGGGSVYSSSGLPITLSPDSNPIQYTYIHPKANGEGGDGGSGGAGLLIVSRGASFGLSGLIDLTGLSGNLGGAGYSLGGKLVYGGSGVGGTPGACYFLYDGSYTIPNIDGKVGSQQGDTPVRGTRLPDEGLVTTPGTTTTEWYDETSSFNSGSINFIYSEEDTQFQYIQDNLSPTIETPEYTAIPLNISAIEIVNTPASALGILSTIEITVTKPSDTSYSYANVYYRKLGDIEWNFLNPSAASGPTSKVTQIVDSDGETWEYLALSVSLAGNELEAGKQTSIQTTNVVDAPSSEPDLPTWLPLATPQTLQLVGGGAVFNGRSPQITWSYDGTANPPPQHFDYYKIEIYSAAGADVLRRVVKSTDPWFEYTEEMGIEDAGPYREIRFDITSVGLKGHESLITTATYTNPQSGLPAATEVIPSFAAIEFGYTKPADNDWKGILVYLSEVNGFTANADTLVYEGSDTAVHLTQFANGGVLAPVEPGTTYYLKYQTYDAFDQTGMTLSAQQSVLIQSVNVADIDGLSNWATQIADVDAAFIAANMADEAISSTQISTLVAGKISAGTISSEITISGLFRTSATGFRVDMGPVVDGTDTFVFRYHDGIGNDRFSIDDAGNVIMDQGTLTAASITGGTIQTVSGTGERVVLNGSANELQVYNSSNSLIASLGRKTLTEGDTTLNVNNGVTASFAAVITSNSQSHPALWVVNESQPTAPTMLITTDTYTHHPLEIEMRDKAIKIYPNPGLGVGNGSDHLIDISNPITTRKAAIHIDNTNYGSGIGINALINGGVGLRLSTNSIFYNKAVHLHLTGIQDTAVPIHQYFEDGFPILQGAIVANGDGRLFVTQSLLGESSNPYPWNEVLTEGSTIIPSPASVGRSELKTSTVTHAGSVPSESVFSVVIEPYSLAPMLYTNAPESRTLSHIRLVSTVNRSADQPTVLILGQEYASTTYSIEYRRVLS